MSVNFLVNTELKYVTTRRRRMEYGSIVIVYIHFCKVLIFCDILFLSVEYDVKDTYPNIKNG